MLLLCTANQCRSPMAEVVLRRRVDAAGVGLRVASAGLLPGGMPATDHARAVMSDLDLDLSGHRSQQVDEAMIAGADLVIGMTREHVREAAVLAPAALARTFTLKELVRAAASVGRRKADEPIEAWLARVGAGRRRDALSGVGHDETYDIADPVGRSRADYEATARELDRLLGALVDLAWSAHLHQGQERSA